MSAFSLPWLLLLALIFPGQAKAALAPCHLPGLSEAVQCGSIERPLDLGTPDGKRIAVAFAVVPARARGKREDPVYFLAGGPGQSARGVLAAVLPALQRLNNRRDLVFVDQRGTGASAPLVCPAERNLPLAEVVDPKRVAARLQACRAALEALPHGELRQYTTSIAVTDLEAVREYLGHARINLIGVSYGTRVALEYQRRYAQAVRRAVLDGVVPPDASLLQTMAEDAERALDRLFDDCAADVVCRADHPQLRANWRSLLESRARSVTIRNPLTGAAETLPVDGRVAASLVRGPLYAPALAAGLPAAIEQAAAGDWGGLAALSSALGGAPGQELAMGMHFSVLCAEDAETTGAAPAGVFGQTLHEVYAPACRDWPKGRLDA